MNMTTKEKRKKRKMDEIVENTQERKRMLLKNKWNFRKRK